MKKSADLRFWEQMGQVYPLSVGYWVMSISSLSRSRMLRMELYFTMYRWWVGLSGAGSKSLSTSSSLSGSSMSSSSRTLLCSCSICFSKSAGSGVMNSQSGQINSSNGVVFTSSSSSYMTLNSFSYSTLCLRSLICFWALLCWVSMCCSETSGSNVMKSQSGQINSSNRVVFTSTSFSHMTLNNLSYSTSCLRSFVRFWASILNNGMLMVLV